MHENLDDETIRIDHSLTILGKMVTCDSSGEQMDFTIIIKERDTDYPHSAKAHQNTCYRYIFPLVQYVVVLKSMVVFCAIITYF